MDPLSSQRQTTNSQSPSAKTGVVLPLSFVGDDVALVKALKANHPGAKAALFDRYSRHVERVIYHVLGIDPESQDVLHDSFVGAFGAIHTLNDPKALKAWLSRVAVLTARKLLRSRSRRSWLRLFVDDAQEQRYEPVVLAHSAEELQTVRATYEVLNSLPLEERIVFSLRYIEGMDLLEVASTCAVSLATVKRRIRKAEERFMRMAARRPALAEHLKGETQWQDH